MAHAEDELLNRYYESWLGVDAVYEKWAARRELPSICSIS